MLLIAMSVMTLTAAQAQDDSKSISVTAVEALRAGNTVTISMTIDVGGQVTQDKNSLIVCPVLHGSGERTALTPIIIRGKHARTSDENRAMEGNSADTGAPYITANGQRLDYMVSIPYQSWMRGSDLVFNGINAGRRNATEVNIGLVADNLLRGVVQAGGPADRPEATAETDCQSTGDKLAARFPFVESFCEFTRIRQTDDELSFNYDMPLTFGTETKRARSEDERFIGMTQEGALVIRFRQGDKTISREFMDNNRALVDLISSIRTIEAASDTRIARIVIVGFSSPEGVLDENANLSMERAKVARDFLTANSTVSPDAVGVYSGSVDWYRLRDLVAASDMPDKYTILTLIDNTQLWDSSRNRGRMGELMALNEGEPYRYIQKHFFPQLRQTGTYIKVYYENK